jgi:small-conductance mechanosensitive channel
MSKKGKRIKLNFPQLCFILILIGTPFYAIWIVLNLIIAPFSGTNSGDKLMAILLGIALFGSGFFWLFSRVEPIKTWLEKPGPVMKTILYLIATIGVILFIGMPLFYSIFGHVS